MVLKETEKNLEIIEILLKNDLHVRGIAKLLQESHSTTLRRLHYFEEINVVDAKVEGKNKVFFLKKNLTTRNFILQAEINKLTKLILKHPELGILFEEILKNCKDSLIILFGSYAKGLAKSTSDIDIYIETTSRKTKKIIEDINSKISIKIGSFNKESPLVKEIIKDHIIIRGVEEFYDKK